MPSIDKLRHNIRHAVSLSAFSPNLIHRIRYFFSLYSYFPRLLNKRFFIFSSNNNDLYKLFCILVLCRPDTKFTEEDFVWKINQLSTT